MALFIWSLESLIGLIPYIAHVATSMLVPAASNRPVESVQPELCVLSVVASALALLSLLRDWFKGEVTAANALTVTLAIANMMACLAGSFLYALAANDLLTPGGHLVPAITLIGALGASMMLAAERGFSSER